MAKYLKNKLIFNFFTCPFCNKDSRSTLRYSSRSFQCIICKRKYRIYKHIVEFVTYKDLNMQSKKELKGNILPIETHGIEHYANKDNWSSYYNHYVNYKFNILINYLNQIAMKGLISLGSGPGFELKEILKRKYIKTVLSSDLALAATEVVPFALKKFKVDMGLFTSDLNHSPVIPNNDYPILIYEALHHTGDIHYTIGSLLKRGYKYILFVEPTTNFVVKILAKYGLAQRVEYSGLKPDFLDVNKLKKMAKYYNYTVNIHTLWDIPEDFVRIICKRDSYLEYIILKIVDLVSFIGNIFSFGSFSVVSLERKNE